MQARAPLCSQSINQSITPLRPRAHQTMGTPRPAPPPLPTAVAAAVPVVSVEAVLTRLRTTLARRGQGAMLGLRSAFEIMAGDVGSGPSLSLYEFGTVRRVCGRVCRSTCAPPPPPNPALACARPLGRTGLACRKSSCAPCSTPSIRRVRATSSTRRWRRSCLRRARARLTPSSIP